MILKNEGRKWVETYQQPPLLAAGTRGMSIWWRLGVPRPFRDGESLSSGVGTMVEGVSEVV